MGTEMQQHSSPDLWLQDQDAKQDLKLSMCDTNKTSSLVSFCYDRSCISG